MIISGGGDGGYAYWHEFTAPVARPEKEGVGSLGSNRRSTSRLAVKVSKSPAEKQEYSSSTGT